MLVTTAYNPSPDLIQRAKRFADKVSGEYVPRGRRSLERLFGFHQARFLFVVTDRGIKCFEQGEASPLFFHPSMAYLRIKRMLQGYADPLVELAEVKNGDAVLDCTAGLASDAIVFSFAAGFAGKVTALESEKVIWALVSDGLQRYESGVPEMDEAMRRIELIHGDHEEMLKNLDDRSFDVVYFDPMFRTPVEESSAIAPLRNVANRRALSPEAIAEACRVARKTVILKEHKDSTEFARLGFEQIRKTSSNIAYGVIRCARH